MLIAIVAVVVCCANPGTPTGGPKDRKPPVLLKSVPEPNATGFNGTIITMTFDENIQLKDQDTKFVVSPPLKPSPKLDAHGKILRVRFDNDTCLMPGTTYTLDFADCLSDLNESNIYENFTFTFSTGESQDTMMISGNVYDAETITPQSGVYVLLHSDLSDTAFAKTPPLRIAKTNEEGRFAIKNVPAERKYKIYVLDDQNRNFLYDQPGEMIGWLADVVTPSHEIRQINDSVRVDTLWNSKDTAEWIFEPRVRDTLVYTPDSLVLFTFTEKKYDQYITSDARNKRNQISLTFNNEMQRPPKFSFPGQDPNVDHAVFQYSQHYDTCTIWLTDSIVYKGDSVVLAIEYPVLDSLDNMVAKQDTMDFWFLEQPETKQKKKKKRGEAEKVVAPSLRLKTTDKISFFGKVSLSAETPLASIDWNAIHLQHKVDTLFEDMTYEVLDDTINICQKFIKAKWEADQEYKLTIDSASVYDIFGLPCKKQEQRIVTSKLDSYGALYIVLDSIPADGLLQLLPTKGTNVARQMRVPPSGKVGFRYLAPGEYMIRIVEDKNHNDKWDSGRYNFLRPRSFDADSNLVYAPLTEADTARILPEKTLYYMSSVKVRANWDIKVDFKLSDFTVDAFAKKFRTKKNNRRKR